jgi:hypothetical protein
MSGLPTRGALSLAISGSLSASEWADDEHEHAARRHRGEFLHGRNSTTSAPTIWQCDRLHVTKRQTAQLRPTGLGGLAMG